jgi:hypothetical protein
VYASVFSLLHGVRKAPRERFHRRLLILGNCVMFSFRWFGRRRRRSGQTFRPTVCVLEDRHMPSATAYSLLGLSGTLASVRIFAAANQGFPIHAKAERWLNIHRPAQQLVIRSAAELTADAGLSESQLAAQLNVSSINWATQMIVVVTGGFGPFAAWSPRPNITSLTENNGTLAVKWDSLQPNPDQPFPMWETLTDPAQFVLTSRFAGPVQFQFDGTVVLLPPG